MSNFVEKVYVVIASQGEYSDRSEWIVTVYMEEEMAQDHVRLANEQCKKYENLTWEERERAEDNPYDPNHGSHTYYHGSYTYYRGEVFWYEEVPLYRHIDEFLENIHKWRK
jgi:hypothetical protein